MPDTLVPCPDCIDGPPIPVFAIGVTPETDLGALAKHLQTCTRCNGTEQIPERELSWIRTGRAMKEERLADGLGLRQAAEQRGILPSVLNAMERGLIEPVPHCWCCGLEMSPGCHRDVYGDPYCDLCREEDEEEDDDA